MSDDWHFGFICGVVFGGLACFTIMVYDLKKMKERWMKEIKISDIRIDVSGVLLERGLPSDFVWIRMTHKPTGKVVSRDRVHIKKKGPAQDEMLRELKTKVNS